MENERRSERLPSLRRSRKSVVDFNKVRVNKLLKYFDLEADGIIFVTEKDYKKDFISLIIAPVFVIWYWKFK
jgi:hypothetical protein